MQIQTLPVPVVQFLNALTWGCSVDDLLEGFLAEQTAARRWLHKARAYSVSDGEKGALDNLGFLWEEVDAALQLDRPLPALVSPLTSAYALMAEVTRGRQALNASPHPDVNDLLLAGLAWLQGRGETRGVEERLEAVEEHVDNLFGRFEVYGVELNQAAQGLLTEAFTQARVGLSRLHLALATADPELLERGLNTLSEADSLLESYRRWELQREQRLMEASGRLHIPVAGFDLELCLEFGHKTLRSRWGKGVTRLEEVVLPRLEAFWAEVRRSILLRPHLREERLGAVDAALDELARVVSNLLAPELSREEALAHYEAALVATGAAFAGLREACLTRHTLTGPAGLYFDAIAGVLAETVPDGLLAELLRREPLGCPDLTGLLSTYLREGGVELLDSAIEVLLELAEPPAPAATWRLSLAA